MPVFKNDSSRTRRIPGEPRTEKKENFINKNTACPNDDPWAGSRSIVGTFDGDFMADRNQPQYNDKREEL